MKQKIYQYVNSHLDEHGRFTATNLCDDRYATFPVLSAPRMPFTIQWATCPIPNPPAYC